MKLEYAKLVVRTLEEALKATKEGYDLHTTIEGVQIWRKPV